MWFMANNCFQNGLYSLLNVYAPCATIHNLQLRPSLRLLQYRLHFGRFHYVSFDLQLATHEQLLRIRLARNQLPKVLVAQDQRDSSLLALRSGTLANCAAVLEVNVP
jgi:hypothetical protein